MADKHFRCQPNAFGAKSNEGKACTCCKQWKPFSDFHKKLERLNSHCKTCVSERKARRRASQRKLRAQLKRNSAGFNSVTSGELSATQLDAFADVLGAAIKEVIDDTQIG